MDHHTSDTISALLVAFLIVAAAVAIVVSQVSPDSLSSTWFLSTIAGLLVSPFVIGPWATMRARARRRKEK